MNNLNNILDYLKVFNNIDKKPEPRFMAQGGRLQYKPGGIVEPGVTHYATKVKAKHLGSGLFETTYPGGSKSYYGQIMRKGKRLKFNNKDKSKVLEWLEETKKLKAAPSVVQQQQAEGLLLDKPKYKKALGDALDEVFAMQEKGYGGIRELTQKYKNMFSKKGTIQYGRKLTTDITTEGTALVNAIRAEAKKLGIEDVNAKKMEKALDFYRNKKIINQGDIVKIAKKFEVNYNTFSGTLFKKDYRKLIPLQEGTAAEKKKAIAKAYNYAKKIYSSPRYENLIIGTPETQLGHATDVYSQHITPEDLVYTPAKINQEALKEIDATHKSIYEKRAKLLKNKPDGWQKEVERLNTKGIFLADKSQGYKNFNVMRADGSTYKYGVDASKTIDPLSIAEGKKLKDLTKAEKDLIELNRKEVFKAQDKMGKKEINKTVSKILKNSGLPCALANGINCSDPRAYIKSINELKAKAALGDKAAFTKFKKVANAMRKFKGVGAVTGWGLLGEIGFALPFAAMDYADGKSTAQIMNNASFGLFGMNEEEEAISYLPKDSLGGAIPSAMRAGERIDRLTQTPILEGPRNEYIGYKERIFPKSRMGMDENKFQKAQAKVLADAELDFKDKLEPFLEGPRNEYYNPEKSAKAFGDFEIAKAKQTAMQEQKAKEIAEPTKYGIEFKKGGRVSFKVGGIDKGRRAFLKLLAALGIGTATAGTGLIKLGGKAVGKKAAVKTGVDIATGTQGMPDWFPALVNKVIKEGDDVTTKLATQERQLVHTKKLPDGESATVYRDLDTGDIRVEYDSVDIMGEGAVGPVQIEYKAGQVIDEGTMKGKKTKSEFSAVESEPRYEMVGPDDAEVNWDSQNIVGNVDDLMSDTTKLKNYAEGKKPTINEIVTRKRKTDEVKNINKDTSAQVDYSVDKYGEGDYASGGRVSYFDGGIVSLKKKW